MKSWFPLLFLILLGCSIQKPPKLSYAEMDEPAAPDYGFLENWAAHPDKVDPADRVPDPSLQNGQDKAAVDVFFIHPTTYFGKKTWNGDLRDAKLNEQTDKSAILHQASVFNGSTRVFAPRYRQMVYSGFFVKTPDEYKSARSAALLAYADVLHAFEYYLKHENKGRPFILAGHSQGTAHAIHLMRDKEQDPQFREQLVAAYLPGWSVKQDTFQFIPPCSAAEDVHCFLSWCTYQWGAEPDDPDWYEGGVCINPVNWTASSDIVAKDGHQGLVLKDFAKIYRNASATKVNGNILWIEKPKVPGAFLLREKNYHIGDYNLFWMDVRKNVEARVAAYQKHHLVP